MMKLFSCLDEVKALQDIEHIESRNYQLPVMAIELMFEIYPTQTEILR